MQKLADAMQSVEAVKQLKSDSQPPANPPAALTPDGKTLYHPFPSHRDSDDGRECATCRNWHYLTDDIGSAYPCPECEAVAQQKRVDSLRSMSSWIPGDEYTLDSFQLRDASSILAAQTVRQFCESDKPAFIYLHGTPGAGKTHLAAATINYMRDHRRASLFMTAPDLLGFLRESFDEGYIEREDGTMYRLAFEDRMRMLCRVEVLVIDDFGAENESDFTQETMYRLIDSRYREKRKTFITSNLGAEDLSERRISSRLRDRAVCVVVSMMGRDYRTLAATQRIDANGHK